jgi:hypothetical protein
MPKRRGGLMTQKISRRKRKSRAAVAINATLWPARHSRPREHRCVNRDESRLKTCGGLLWCRRNRRTELGQ